MATTYDQFVLFGDSLLERASITENGYSLQSALQTHCARRLDVINRGMSGWNSKYALRYLPEIFPPRTNTSPRIRYLAILLGTNDSSRLDHPWGGQGTSLAEFKANLTSIITHENIRAHNPRILLISPPPVNEIGVAELVRSHGMQGGPPHVPKLTAKFSQAVLDIGSELQAKGGDIRLLDLRRAILEEAQESTTPSALQTLVPDGLHLGRESYEILYSLILENMEPFPPGTDGYVYPSWWHLTYGKSQEEVIAERTSLKAEYTSI